MTTDGFCCFSFRAALAAFALQTLSFSKALLPQVTAVRHWDRSRQTVSQLPTSMEQYIREVFRVSLYLLLGALMFRYIYI